MHYKLKVYYKIRIVLCPFLSIKITVQNLSDLIGQAECNIIVNFSSSHDTCRRLSLWEKERDIQDFSFCNHYGAEILGIWLVERSAIQLLIVQN